VCGKDIVQPQVVNACSLCVRLRLEAPVTWNSQQRKAFYSSRGCNWRFLLRWAIVCEIMVSPYAATFSRAQSGAPARNETASSQDAQIDSLPTRLSVVDGQDIRFRRLSGGAALSQTRVGWVVQDNLGFIWFGTQYGLNRYDGYRSKVFKHEPGRSDSLSCVYIRSLFVDHSGALWVGCDRTLDKFEPINETFAHYRIDKQDPGSLPTPIERITEDHAGRLWLATGRGLYRFDPASGQTTRYVHDPADPTSIAGNRVNFAAEDRAGRFWIASSGGLEEFDRKTEKVIRRVPFRSEVSQFHEDKFGLVWITASTDSSCTLATLNLTTNLLTCHSIEYKSRGVISPINAHSMLESREGTIWLSSSNGLLKLDREHKQIINYRNHPSDNESLESNHVLSPYQDKEGNIWTCFQEVQPNFFAERPQAFENFTYQRGSLANALVTSIYEDHSGILWIGSMGGLNRIDRRTGRNIVPAGAGVGNEILSILEDHSGALFSGTYHQGLRRLDPETGKLSPYVRGREPSNLARNPIMRLIFDHEGTLWAATYGGVSRFDRARGNFITYTPERQNTIQYQEIKEDSKGTLWLGAQSGLHRFDPRTEQFTTYEHDPNDRRSLSDNRVNSVHFDHSGNMWVGTQNGLDKFDSSTRTFKAYYERDGLAGDVVSCILEDKGGLLWMSTNNGLSSFDPQSQRFQSFSAADGLPGPDLTGWGACYESPSGEMFFGGFSGATAFYPSQIVNSSFVPRTVLTDFRLSGNPVPIGSKSPLKQSITYTDAITLSHQQNIFSIEFSALSYFNAETNRYRYRLDGLDDRWHEVGSSQRTASYTTLPVSTYIFQVQGASSRGKWSEPGVTLRIEILPAWYQTFLFRGVCVLVFLLFLWSIYQLRLKQLEQQFNTALEARVDERTRIARELHDTLLQTFHGLLFRFQAARNMLPRRLEEGIQALDGALDTAEQAIAEGRDAIQDLRSGPAVQGDLAQLLTAIGQELARSPEVNRDSAAFRVTEEGERQDLSPILQDEVYRIGREVLRNAFRHARAREIEAEIRYDDRVLRVRIRDDGKGIDPRVLEEGGRAGHWGLPGIRERAKRIGARLDFWSEAGAGTEVELTVPASVAYGTPPSGPGFKLFRKKRGDS
jgi:ligand-binding sensor domain-containing protein/signal transduction histidine kinase